MDVSPGGKIRIIRFPGNPHAGPFTVVGLQDAKIGVYRAIAGRYDHSHRITISLPSPERLAAFLDLAASNSQLLDWLKSTASLRTVVANSTSREITK